MTVRLIERQQLGLKAKVRRALGAAVTDGFFGAAAKSTRYLPIAHPGLHRVRVERDVPYRPSGRIEHTLDVYRPGEDAVGPRPCVLYVHGGGFRVLSKDTHWLFGLAYARQGFVVLSINYRLAPEHPFPAAIEDLASAYQWLVTNAARLEIDPSRIVVAGESAGANLAVSLTLATTLSRPEGFARDVFGTGVVPRAVVAACGLFEVSRPERFSQHHVFFRDRIEEVTDAYLGGLRVPEGLLDFADPVRPLERGEPTARPLPPVFVPCGTWDVLLDDSRRLHRALVAAGSTRSRFEAYPRGPHAFHAFVFTKAARSCWRDTFQFLDDAGAAPPRSSR
jgi:acetyl esterase